MTRSNILGNINMMQVTKETILKTNISLEKTKSPCGYITTVVVGVSTDPFRKVRCGEWIGNFLNHLSNPTLSEYRLTDDFLKRIKLGGLFVTDQRQV